MNTKLVHYVINKYYKGYRNKFYEDLYSYGLEALCDAYKFYDPAKNKKSFEYYATCVIRRRLSMFVRDRISKTYQNTTFLSDNRLLESFGGSYQNELQNIDLYRAIKKLNDQEKEILYLMYEKEYTLRDIAKKYGFCHQYAYRKHKKIINKLRKMLKNEL